VELLFIEKQRCGTVSHRGNSILELFGPHFLNNLPGRNPSQTKRPRKDLYISFIHFNICCKLLSPLQAKVVGRKKIQPVCVSSNMRYHQSKKTENSVTGIVITFYTLNKSDFPANTFDNSRMSLFEAVAAPVLLTIL
jgi:hypothetical protein